MSQYLLSVHTVAGGAQGARTPEEMEEYMGRVTALETEMKATDTFVFGGRLHEPDMATVVRISDGNLGMTDGPFAETKEQIGGFYIINADDLDAALAWAGKVVAAINAPIEVRPFFASTNA